MTVDVSWESWTPELLINEYKKQVAKNAEGVGIRMRNRAAGRLRAVKLNLGSIQPNNKSDARYRRYVASAIRHQIEVEGDDVILSVGVAGEHRYTGYYIEIGSKNGSAQNYLRRTLIQDLPDEIGALFT